jgi:hypothetical protein
VLTFRDQLDRHFPQNAKPVSARAAKPTDLPMDALIEIATS